MPYNARNGRKKWELLSQDSPSWESQADASEETFSDHIYPASDSVKTKLPSRDNVLWVDWDGLEDPSHPKNWSPRKKWAVTLILSCFAFISPISSTMVAPATSRIAGEFSITNPSMISMTTSIFVLGYCIGPLIIGPLSEIYGRQRVLQSSYLFYLLWNTACALAQSHTQLLAFRILSGLGGSAPLAIGAAIIGDVWHPEERGRAIGIYCAAPLLGPVVGPVCGAWVAEYSSWRWVFWSTSAVALGIQVVGLFFFKETFAPYLLEQKAKSLEGKLDSEQAEKYQYVRSIYEGKSNRSWQAIFKIAMTRPFQLFYHETIIQILGVYFGFIYGIYYLYLTQIPPIFEHVYHQPVGIAGLHYIALGTGVTIASQANAMFMDPIYTRFKAKNRGIGEPEFRLPSMMVGSVILPIGLLLSGWSAEYALHWIITDVGMVFVGMGVILVFQSIQAYMVDAFTLHAASALATAATLRSLAGFGFPLFAPSMYQKLGFGKGDTLLACLAIVIGCPAPILLWRYGNSIRAGSRYARQPLTHGPTRGQS
ncbi:MFS polyamine transporter [Crepidotus variabilis]|uniref:MFS polyamine transporter n=1 Tax=Crepidotus variabilis TaxID=179855 RepID=A0A9P6EM42_9AGAR|nr:MFS polyamine transporter [Crepidotus variabilis]